MLSRKPKKNNRHFRKKTKSVLSEEPVSGFRTAADGTH